jgi:hypothetical protein
MSNNHDDPNLGITQSLEGWAQSDIKRLMKNLSKAQQEEVSRELIVIKYQDNPFTRAIMSSVLLSRVVKHTTENSEVIHHVKESLKSVVLQDSEGLSELRQDEISTALTIIEKNHDPYAQLKEITSLLAIVATDLKNPILNDKLVFDDEEPEENIVEKKKED